MGTEVFVLITIGVCFGAAAALIGLAGLHPRYRARAHELWPFYRSEILIIGAILIPATLGGWYFAALLIAFVWRGQVEMFRLFDALAWGAGQAAAVIAASALIALGTLRNFTAVGIVLCVGAATVVLAGLLTSTDWRKSVIGVSTLVYPGLLAALIGGLRASADGLLWLLFVYGTVEIADSFALLLGKLFGRTRIFPSLSSGKTAEGVIAGFCFGGAGGLLLGHYLAGLSWVASMRMAAVILVVGLVGDIAASALKRWRGKKDFAPVLRLHGGVLDIYDSFLLAAPAAFLLRPFLAT